MDYKQIEITYNILGRTSGLLTQDMGIDIDGSLFFDENVGGQSYENRRAEEILKRKRQQSSAQIRYMSPTFIFDIQHDWGKAGNERYFTKNFYSLIIDEFDSLFMDQSISEFIIAVQGLPATFGDALGYELSGKFARILLGKIVEKTLEERKAARVKGQDNVAQETNGYVITGKGRGDRPRMSAAGKTALDGLVKDFVEELKNKKMTNEAKRLEAAMTNNAAWENRVAIALDYILNHSSDNFVDLEAKSIVLIDIATGRDAKGRVWHGGLHQAACVAQGITVTTEGTTTSKLTLFDVLADVYDFNVVGTSGTLREAHEETFERLGKYTSLIPDFEKNPQRLFNTVHVAPGGSYLKTLELLIQSLQDNCGQPVVIERNDITELTGWYRRTMYLIYMCMTEEYQRIATLENPTAADESFRAKYLKEQELFNKFTGSLSRTKTLTARDEAEKVFNMLNDTQGQTQKKALRGMSLDSIDCLEATTESREGDVVKNAGLPGRISFVTDIAGRATDIQLQEIKKMISSTAARTDITPEEKTWMLTRLDYIKTHLDLMGKTVDGDQGLKIILEKLKKYSSKDTVRTEFATALERLIKMVESGQLNDETGKTEILNVLMGIMPKLSNAANQEKLRSIIGSLGSSASFAEDFANNIKEIVKTFDKEKGVDENEGSAYSGALGTFVNLLTEKGAAFDMIRVLGLTRESADKLNYSVEVEEKGKKTKYNTVLDATNLNALQEIAKMIGWLENDADPAIDLSKLDSKLNEGEPVRLREKTSFGDFTDKTKEARKLIAKEIQSQLLLLNVVSAPGTSAPKISDTLRNELSGMLMTRFMYGLRFIGQKSPLIRTDRQKHGRPGRAGMPGEYVELIENGLDEFDQGTPEYHMVAGLNGQFNFKFGDDDEAFEQRLNNEITKLRAELADKKNPPAPERKVTINKKLGMYTSLNGLNGDQLYNKYILLYYECFGMVAIFRNLEVLNDKMKSLLDEKRLRTDMTDKEKTINAEQIEKTADQILTLASKIKDRIDEKRSILGYEQTSKMDRPAMEAELARLRSSLDEALEQLAAANGDLVTLKGRVAQFYVWKNSRYGDKFEPNSAPNIDAKAAGEELAIRLRMIEQIFYASQLFLEQNQKNERMDMDRRSVMRYQSEMFKMERDFTSEFRSLPTELLGIVNEEIFVKKNELIALATGDIAGRSGRKALSKLLSGINVSVEARVKTSIPGLSAELNGKHLMEGLSDADSAYLKFTEWLERTHHKKLSEVSASDVIDYITNCVIDTVKTAHGDGAIKKWMLSRGGSVNIYKVKEGIGKESLRYILKEFWGGISSAKDRKKKDEKYGERENDINKKLEALSWQVARVFGQWIAEERALPGLTEEEQTRFVNAVTLKNIMGESGSVDDITEEAILDFLVKELFEKRKASVPVSDEEIIFRVASMRTALLAEESELRQKGYSKRGPKAHQ
ncbi:MAG: hypothetical protein HQL28_05800 [Candidatus Omnitrophica bacterium]|nr:hypothetical protein [Candidatus Omnitrophota bacterium]